MKIAIITQQLGTNYGGILQAYALQCYFQNKGYQVEVVDYYGNKRVTIRILLSIIKRFLKKYLMRQPIDFIAPLWMYRKSFNYYYQYTFQFISDNIAETPYIKNWQKLNKMGFDVFVVGSDQVWRPKNNRFTLPQMFLQFAKRENVKRIAYAASLGVSTWEYSPKQTKRLTPLAQRFDAISVRESSAIELLKNKFHVSAMHVLDPTMLLDISHYQRLLEQYPVISSAGNLFAYLLDLSEKKRQMIDRLSQQTNSRPFNILPIDNQNYTNPMPSPAQWIRSFMDADFVFTDSFHGAVFSILFNKQFLIYGNKSRGIARFESLLDMFQIENRMVEKVDDIQINLLQPIDYRKVNVLLNQYRAEAADFFQKAFSN